MATRPILTQRRTEKLDLRVSPAAKAKLQAAAAAAHRSVSDFVMESALSRAEEALADRRVFGTRRREVGRISSRPRCTGPSLAQLASAAR